MRAVVRSLSRNLFPRLCPLPGLLTEAFVIWIASRTLLGAFLGLLLPLGLAWCLRQFILFVFFVFLPFFVPYFWSIFQQLFPFTHLVNEDPVTPTGLEADKSLCDEQSIRPPFLVH